MTHTTLFSHWHKSKVWELTNYKKPWKENGIKPQLWIKTNGANKKKGDTCFSFTITFGYLLFNYTNYDLQGRKRGSMSEENGKVCCNCRHNKRYYDEGGMCYCECEVSGKWLGYMQVMTGWCRHWAKQRDDKESEDKE